MTHLTPNFTLEELTTSEAAARHGWDNTPNPAELANLKRLADVLEQVRALLGGKPLMISSGFRCKLVNDSVGSKDTSQHRTGCAADFRAPGLTPDQVVKAVKASGIGYDQVIREFDRWVHLSIPNSADTAPRQQALIIDSTGTHVYA